MAFGIDDAAVVEVATEEMVSEVGSSGSSSLESISENSLSEEFSPDFFSESSSSDFLETSSPEAKVSFSEGEAQLPNTIEEDFSPRVFDEAQGHQISEMIQIESTPTQIEVPNSELEDANSLTEKLEEHPSSDIGTNSEKCEPSEIKKTGGGIQNHQKKFTICLQIVVPIWRGMRDLLLLWTMKTINKLLVVVHHAKQRSIEPLRKS